MVQADDTPADLAQRLETHGLVLAGSAALMVRRGLDDLEMIPLNPAVTVTPADANNDEQLDAILRIGTASFNWAPEQLPEWRRALLDMARDPERRETEVGYLAYLDGQAVGFGRVSLRGGLAFLSGAGTLPTQRGRRCIPRCCAGAWKRRVSAATRWRPSRPSLCRAGWWCAMDLKSAPVPGFTPGCRSWTWT